LLQITKDKSLDEQAYLYIKQAIVGGVFSPGEFLAELQLAQELGVSRTPIRKAMGRLHEEKFLISVPFKGYYVRDISVEDTIEIYELREILECHIVRETVLQFKTAELDELEAITQSAIAALEREDYVASLACNREFHRTFARKYGNQRISGVLTNLDEHIQRILLYQLQSDPDTLLDSYRDHQLIIAAVRARDVELAVRLMREHLVNFRATLMAQSKNS
jgi:DNA-binding GntR family transcriptional regulator